MSDEDALSGAQWSLRVSPDLTRQGQWLWGPERVRLAGLILGARSQRSGTGHLGSSPCLQSLCPLIQFVCVESLVTALVDMYPRMFRKKNRREVLILGVSVVSFLVGLVMLTEVRAGEAGDDGEEEPSDSCYLSVRQMPWLRVRAGLPGFRTLGLPLFPIPGRTK